MFEEEEVGIRVGAGVEGKGAEGPAEDCDLIDAAKHWDLSWGVMNCVLIDVQS